MLRKILAYGIAAGLVVAVPLFGLAVAMNGREPVPYGMAIGYLTMLVALSAVFIAIKRHRDTDLGGMIGFWRALGLGLGISAVAGLFYVAAWEAALALTHMDFAGSYANLLSGKRRRASAVTRSPSSPRTWRPSRPITRIRSTACR
ncbi:hypothetical protein FHW12_000542 [Dokdonella fugitiva]|uniref:Uncharacterized protein n=1 Tax=Dokdonella fugitiva TaxID=328517 RepID=A0A839F2A3_9GAMM|nr:DUF4199 domain-containing protein [Dokdonella fugitiva]MBA8886351.1 hypothetical protein [Dokdonella fugitiva]